MKKKICYIFFALVGCSFFVAPAAKAQTYLESSEQFGGYQKDIWVHDDGSKTILMIDSDGRVISVITISSMGTLMSLLP